MTIPTKEEKISTAVMVIGVILLVIMFIIGYIDIKTLSNNNPFVLYPHAHILGIVDVACIIVFIVGVIAAAATTCLAMMGARI